MSDFTCTQCANQVPNHGDICTSCWEQIPSIFQCVDCGETCYKKDGDFGGYAIPVNMETDDVEYVCSECLELSSEESGVEERYQNEEQFRDHFSDEYLNEQF